jgi:hypothetical protein
LARLALWIIANLILSHYYVIEELTHSLTLTACFCPRLAVS